MISLFKHGLLRRHAPLAFHPSSLLFFSSQASIAYPTINYPEHRALARTSDEAFRSYEFDVNAAFKIEATEPENRESLRCGLLAYKQGMTHYWDKWGTLVPCTVL